jgi:D-lyxose ketol-isomerase
MKLDDIRIVQKEALVYLSKAGIVLTEEEKENIEVADFGLNDLKNIGLEVVNYINNDIYCAKELVLFPGQTCPEHRHPRLSEANPGKRETFRCRMGEVYLYVEGEPTEDIKATIPEKYKEYFTVWHEIILKPGEQYTISSDTLHWFQAGSEGCVVSEFSSTSTDEEDIWTDPNLKRIPVIED